MLPQKSHYQELTPSVMKKIISCLRKPNTVLPIIDETYLIAKGKLCHFKMNNYPKIVGNLLDITENNILLDTEAS